MNRIANLFSRAASQNAAQQSPNTLAVECLEERQMLSTVDIVALGGTGEETIELIIEGETVAVFENVSGDVGGVNINGRDFVTLSYSTDEVIDPAGIEVAFTNDLFDPENGIDRNVRIDSVVVNLEANGTPDEQTEILTNTIFTFDTDDSTVFSTGTFRTADGITPGFDRGDILHGNGSFTYDGTADGQGSFVGATVGARGSNIQINAQGSTGDEQFNLLIDDEVVQTYDVTTELAEYRFNTDDVISARQVRVEFINDFYDPANGIDRNLTVGSIRVNSQLFQTEAPSTFSTGVFRAGEGIVSGFNETETLSANGFFQYLASPGETLQFAGQTFFTDNDSSQVFVDDGLLTVRGTPSSVASTSFTVDVIPNRPYELSFDAYRDIISGSFTPFFGEPFGSIGLNFNDAEGNIVGRTLITDVARDAQSDGFRSRELLSPANATSATVFVFAGLTTPGTEIPLIVRDIQFTLLNANDVSPPELEFVNITLIDPAPSIEFSLRVTDESELQFLNGPNPVLTLERGDLSTQLTPLRSTEIDGGIEFFYELPAAIGAVNGEQFTAADNGVFLTFAEPGTFSDSFGNTFVRSGSIATIGVFIFDRTAFV